MLRLIAVMINGIGSGMIWCTKKLDKGNIHNTRVQTRNMYPNPKGNGTVDQ
jgi:hypothetical protein